MAVDDAAGFEAARHARPLTTDDRPLVAVPQEWRTVGHLYRGIEAGLSYLCDRDGEDAVFILPHRDAAWKIIKERLRALEQACLSLAKQAGLEVLAQLAEQLHAMGDEVSSRLAMRGE